MREISIKIGEMVISGAIRDGDLKQNLQHEITKVKSNQFYGGYQEYYQLNFWGDNRVIGLHVSNVRILRDKTKEDEQSLYNCKFYKLSDAIKVMLKTYSILTTGENNYLNRYIHRDKLKIERLAYQVGFKDLILKKDIEIMVNNERMGLPRDFIKTYLKANLKGTGFYYSEREGFEGTPKEKKEKLVLVDFDMDQTVFTIKTAFTEKELKMPKISIKDPKFINELVLACEYIISLAGNARENIKLIKKEEF